MGSIFCYCSVGTVRDPNWLSIYQVNVLSSGRVVWIPYAMFDTTCNLDMSMFPFDTQKCDLTFGSLAYPEFAVNLTFPDPPADAVRDTFYKVNGEFDLVSIGHKRDYRLNPETPKIKFSQVSHFYK